MKIWVETVPNSLLEAMSALPRNLVCCFCVVAMAEEPPQKRIRKIMEDIEWREWTNETKAKRVKLLQYLLAALWDFNMPAPGTDEESASLLEISTSLLELFLMRSVVYADEANDLETFVSPR